MKILTRIIWPDGKWTERSVDSNNQDQIDNTIRIGKSALNKGAEILVRKDARESHNSWRDLLQDSPGGGNHRENHGGEP